MKNNTPESRPEKIVESIATATSEIMPVSLMAVLLIFTAFFSMFLYSQEMFQEAIHAALGPYSVGIGEALIGSLIVTSSYYLVVKIARIYMLNHSPGHKVAMVDKRKSRLRRSGIPHAEYHYPSRE